MKCPPFEELWTKVKAGEDPPHLAICEECAKKVYGLRYAVEVFDGDQAAFEEALAEVIDEELARVPLRHWASHLAGQRRYHHVFVVEELLRRADREYENPRVVVDLTSAAVAVCEALVKSDMAPPSELFINALKKHSAALRSAGNLEGALNTLGRAWAMTGELQNREQLRAVLSLCTAIVYVEPDLGKFDEAIALAESAAAVLDTCGDRRGALVGRQTKAQALATMFRFAEALPIARSVAAEIHGTGSTLDVAIAHHLVAHCCVGVGEYETALHHVAVARRGYEEAGSITGEARVSHERARALAASGRFDEARPEFDRTSEVVFRARLFEQWAIFRLDYIAAALHDDPGANVRADVEAVARGCLMLGGEQSTIRQRYAAEALDYLRRLAIRDALTAEAADYVRVFVSRNASRPPVKFTPPSAAEFVM